MAHSTPSEFRLATPVCDTFLPIVEHSQIGEARRTASRLASDVGLDEERSGKAAIIVSELATNLVRYATQGQIVLQSAIVAGSPRLDLWAIDRGPGISNVSRSLSDGYSTGGTPGNGMGAVQRLSSEFDIFSMDSTGTVIFSRIDASAREHRSSARNGFQWACLSCPAPGETFCGDSWRIAERPHELAIMLVDGLGHGPLAAAAADEACSAFAAQPFAALPDIIQNADRRMRGTRGGAMAIGHLHAESELLRYLGYGNIAGSLREHAGESGRGLVSHNGTVGVQMGKGKDFEYACSPNGLLLMYSDGLQTRWSFEKYPGLEQKHPGVIAGILFRDFTRGRDDVTVAVVRMPHR